MINSVSLNAAASYQAYPHNVASHPLRTPAQQAEWEAKQAHEGILPQLPPEVLAIIADYEEGIIEVDVRIAPSILNGLLKALSGKPEFATEISRIKTVIQLNEPLAIQNTMLEIFDAVRTDLSQLALPEVRFTWQDLYALQEGSIVEVIEKAQLAIQKVAVRRRMIDPALYIELRQLIADREIQPFFDDYLVQFAHVLKGYPWMSEFKIVVDSVEFSSKTVAERADTVRAWLQGYTKWQKFHGTHLPPVDYEGPISVLFMKSLVRLPWEIVGILKRMVNLQRLYLFGLTILPDAMGSLVQLKQLSLVHSRLTTLPEAIGNLTQLTRLELHNNRLRTLPAAIGRLTQLKTLDLYHNELRTLPDTIGRLTQLKELNLHCNRWLIILPASLGTLASLQSEIKKGANDKLLYQDIPIELLPAHEAVKKYTENARTVVSCSGCGVYHEM